MSSALLAPASSIGLASLVLQVVRNPDNQLALTLSSLAFFFGIRWTIWLASLPPSCQFSWGLLAGFTLVFIIYIAQRRRAHSRRKKLVRFAQLMSLDAESLQRLVPKEIVDWIIFKDFEEVGWLNRQLRILWPFLREALSDTIKEQLQPMLDEYKTGVLEKIVITHFCLGDDSPELAGVKFTGGGKDESILEAQLTWKSAKEDIVLKVKTTGPDFKVKVRHVHMMGTLKLVFKPLIGEIPGFGAVLISLSGTPDIDFDVKLLGGEMNSLPGVDKMVDNSIRAALVDSLVWPCRIVWPVTPGDYSFLELRPVGILDVTLIEATDVMNTDVLGKSDPFVLLYVRQNTDRIKRSTTKKNTLHPVWNEGFEIEVDDPESQSLTLRLMDEETVEKAEYIGSTLYPLNELKAGDTKDIWFDLFEDPNLSRSQKPRAWLHVVLFYKPFQSGKEGNKDVRANGLKETGNEDLSTSGQKEIRNQDQSSPKSPETGYNGSKCKEQDQSLNQTERTVSANHSGN